MKRSKSPPGWNSERVKRMLAHYESQSEEEAVAEDEAAFEAVGQTVMEVPTGLVPKLFSRLRLKKEPPAAGISNNEQGTPNLEGRRPSGK